MAGRTRQAEYVATSLPNEQVVMDAQAFDDMISAHGIRYVHWRAMKCPVGLADPDDIRRSHDHHVNCSNGFIYRKVGTITGLHTGNSKDPRYVEAGLIDGSTVQVSFPRVYDDPPDKHFYAAYADRLYIEGADGNPDLLVPHWETVQVSGTGQLKLQFPAARVEHVIDNTGREWSGASFGVESGKIVWQAERPQDGAVLTVWYLYQPYYYCSRILHEIRLTTTIGIDGGPAINRAPYSLLLQRENIFRNEEVDPDAPVSNRQQIAAPDGSFGPT